MPLGGHFYIAGNNGIELVLRQLGLCGVHKIGVISGHQGGQAKNQNQQRFAQAFHHGVGIPNGKRIVE